MPAISLGKSLNTEMEISFKICIEECVSAWMGLYIVKLFPCLKNCTTFASSLQKTPDLPSIVSYYD